MDVTKRKGWDILLKAYTREFSGNKDVGLIFKGYFGGVTEVHQTNLIKRLRAFRDNLHIRNAPDIIFFGDVLPDVHLYQLYKTAHAYVHPTRGEGWCNHPDNRIITDCGYKKIQDIIVGDNVLTDKGEYKNVVMKHERVCSEDLICITPYFHYKPLMLTGNHSVLTAKYSKITGGNKHGDINNIAWKDAKDITKDDYLAFPKTIEDENQKYDDLYFKNFCGKTNYTKKQREQMKEDDQYLWTPIKQIEKKQYNGLVYDLTVKDHSTYISENVVIHNSLTSSEAMSMELPVITTNWSGHLEFCKPDNSYLIDVLGFEETDEEIIRISPNYKDQNWAIPSEEHLRKLMRHVYEHYTEAKARAKRGRKLLKEKFNWKVIGNQILQVIP